MISTLKKILKILVTAILCLVLVLVSAEMTFRYLPNIFVKNKRASESGPITRKALQKKVQARIYRNWNRKRSDAPNPFYLPWVAFENADFENEERLNFIVDKTKFPPSGNWEAYNVFRSSEEKELTKYFVSTNSFGFRDLPRTVKKPKNTFRIIVIGSYVTFGFALNDEDTFVRKVEKKLNTAKLNNLKYEVWNAGRQGSTAIQGYALLKKELLSYKPDLIIFDYGWADPFTNSDSVKKTSAIVDKQFLFEIKQQMYYGAVKLCYINSFTTKILGSSELCIRITDKLSQHQKVISLDGWKESLIKVAEFAKMKKTPVLFLNQAPHIQADVYKSVTDPENKLFFLDTVSYMNAQKIPDEFIENFWKKTNWLTEVGINREEVGPAQYIYLRNDAIQYNGLAHDFMAQRIFEELTKIVPQLKPKNNLVN